MLGPPPLFPVPGPKACVRADGCLAPRGPASTEPQLAVGGRRAEGWAPGLVEPAGAVAISRLYREDVDSEWHGGVRERVWRALASVRWACCLALRYLFAQTSGRQARAWCQARGLTRSALVPARHIRASETLRAQNPHRSEARTVGRGSRGARKRCGNFWAVTRRRPLSEAGGERTPQAATQQSYEWLGSGTIC